jgi:4-amino-4-deoxy-L-arabinose transferase-like glycosyltransferase
MAAGGAVGLTYWIVAELTSGAGGMLATLMLIGCSSLRRVSVLYVSTAPLMLLVLAALWAYLHWRRDRRARWTALVGFFTAWAGITRPLDALCFAVPIGIAMLLDLRGSSPRRYLISLGSLFLAALPLLTLQIICNIGITGSWRQTAWTAYTRHDDPLDGMAIGKIDLSQRSQSTLPQKVEFSDGFTRSAAIERHARHRLANWIKDDLPADVNVLWPHPLLMVLIPIGLMAIGRKPARGVLYATLPLCLLAYAMYTFSVPQYVVIGAPAAALGVVLASEACGRAWPKRSDLIVTAISIAIVGLTCTQLPQFNRIVLDDRYRPSEPRQVAMELSSLDRTPAVVLFHFTPGVDNVHFEPVYYIDVAWPDAARVIRAHDLGSRNREIFQYYPDRAFYMCNPRSAPPRFLGYGRELAESGAGL